MSETNTNPIKSYLLVKTITAGLLATSTIIGAAFIGAAQIDNVWLSIITGATCGFAAYVAIDLMLAAIMGDLIDPKRSQFIKWVLMIILLIATGFFTAIVGLFVGDHMSEPKSTDDKQEIRAAITDRYNERISASQSSADQIKKDIRDLTRQFKKDTAAIIAGMPSNHRKLYRKGLHARYMTRTGYATLKENVSRIDNRISEYNSAFTAKNTTLSTLESDLATMRGADPLETVNAEMKAEEERMKHRADMVSGMIWIFDIVLVFALFFSFHFIRSAIKRDPSIEIPENHFHSWVLDRIKNLSKKMLESTDGSDKGLQYFVKNFLGFFGEIGGLLGWGFHVGSKIVSAPRRMSEKQGFTSFNVVTNDSSPAPSSPARIIGFHQPGSVGEKQVVNTGENRSELSGERVVKASEQRPVQRGGTRFLPGEQNPVNRASEPSGEPVENLGEQRPMKPGEQVVNVQVVNGEPTFHHYSEKLGETKEYTRTEVSRFVSKYAGEIRRIELWLMKNQNKEDVKKVLGKKEQLRQRIRQHEYWLGGLEAIDRIKSK